MRFENRTVIITGAAGGLGPVVAERFFAEGANLVLPVRATSSLRSVAERFGTSSRVFVLHADVAVEADVQRVVEETLTRFTRVDVLVNIAGGYSGGKGIADVSVEEFERMIEINLRTAFLLSRVVLKPMLQQRYGRIVSMSAMPALRSGATRGPYAIAKRGVIALTEIIADEVRGTGVTANVIVPGIILTEENRSSMPDADTSKWTPPEDIAEAILFLSSEQARSINGTTVKMFGGL
jgi:NAD(P)-dependent dehydrogenase (short-subunit alcohol dehydrogenase family)